MTDKTFTFAGVSRLDGEFKVRFANDATRVKVLAKNGHKDIDLIELTGPMTKEDAVAFLLSIDFATRDGVTNQEVQDCLLAEVDKRQEKPVKEPKAKKEKVAKAPKAKKEKAPKEITLEGIKAKKTAPKGTVTKAEIEKQLAEIDAAAATLEDAPF